MHLYRCLDEEGYAVFVYAEDGLEALKVANREPSEYNFTTIELIAEPILIIPEGFGQD